MSAFGPNYDATDHPVCRHCGQRLNEDDDSSMDSGYCSEVCHLAAVDDEDEDEGPVLMDKEKLIELLEEGADTLDQEQ